MIESNSEEIKIYSNFNNSKSIRAFTCASVLSFVFFIASIVLMGLTIFAIMYILLLLLLLAVIFVLKKNEKEPKLSAKITKDRIEMYKGVDVIKYNFDDVVSVTYDTLSSSNYNEIFINYIDPKNGKKKTQFFILRGMRNNEFCNICNTIIEKKKKGVPLDSLKIEKDDNDVNNGKNNDNQKISDLDDDIYCYIGNEVQSEIFNGKRVLNRAPINVAILMNKNQKIFKYIYKKKDNLILNNCYRIIKSKMKSTRLEEVKDAKMDSSAIIEYKSKLENVDRIIDDKECIEESNKIYYRMELIRAILDYVIIIGFVLHLILFAIIRKYLLSSMIFGIPIIVIVIISGIILVIHNKKILNIEIKAIDKK